MSMLEQHQPSRILTPVATAGEHRRMASTDITIQAERADQPDVIALLLQARALLAGLYPPESCHGLDLDAYAMPEVTLFVARAGGTAVGCGALQRHDDGSAEVKSMFVVPEARGRGIGRAILATIEAAVPGDIAALRLETGIEQDAAIRLYEAAGFRRRGPFGRYRDDPLSVFMEKPLPKG
jgi:putative acetyltransferase